MYATDRRRQTRIIA